MYNNELSPKGATSTIKITAHVCPKLFSAIRKSFLEGDMPKAQALQYTLNDFIETLVGQGIFSTTKYCMELQGLEIGPCKKPFEGLISEKREMSKQLSTRLRAISRV
ncbi:MAG: dihydrodipicolinate synthase family protein [Sphaerochaeta sp.]|nr:dihydrodipicolinate synthase family protein [Sphaerochaeta sp.]